MLRQLKVLLRRRKLFRNWLGLGVRYYLMKHGLVDRGNLVARCRGGELAIKPEAYSLIVNAYHNGLIYSVDCGNDYIVLDGIVRIVNNGDSTFFEVPGGVKLLYGDGDYFYTIYETWILGIHFLGFDLRDWLVVDVGAFIGDTPLYYASKGAFVIALEPVPRHYELMIKNLELNPELKGRVLPINVALSNVDGYVDIRVGSEVDGTASIYESSGRAVRVRSFTLSSLMRYIEEVGVDLGKFKVLALKLDCKGCEYDAVNDEAISLFHVLKIEYSGYLRGATVKPLLDKLKELGYDCEVFRHNPFIDIGLERHGTLRCARHV